MSDPVFSQGHVYVIYREGITLRIPFSATDLAGHFCVSSSKLTASSIEELVLLAQECNGLCHATQQKSGNDYLQTNKKTFLINSR
jgi:hypothetical protein